MKIYITGLPSGYEVEHLVRLFYPMAPLTLTPPEVGEDCVWAEKKPDGLWAMVRQGGKCAERTAPLPAPAEAGGETPEFSLASLTYDLLRQWTGIRPPWGKMTGVRPVRLIHDKRAAGWSETDIDHFFLERFDCSEQKYQMAKAIADLQEPILKVGSAPKTYSLYIGIPFCPSRCSYCSFVSCNLDRDRKMVQPYVDCLCREVEEIRIQADKAGLKLCSIYIGGGTPTSLSADQLRQLMGTVRANFDLSKVVEYTVEAGRPDCTDAEKLAVIKEYGATRISINPQTFSDEVLAGIGRKHSAQDILDCYAEARKAGHDDINMDLIAGLPGDTVESFLVDDAQHVQACNAACILRSLALAVVEVGGHRDNGLGHRLAQIALGVAADLGQDHGADLLRGQVLAVDVHPVIAAHVALDAGHGAAGVGGDLPLGRAAHQTLAVFGKGHHAGGGALALCVGDDHRLAAFHHRHTGICCAKVNADHFAHIVFLSLRRIPSAKAFYSPDHLTRCL